MTQVIDFLKPLINRGPMREHFVDVSNKMVEAIFLGGKEFPEPTRLNCFHPNTHRLMDIRDEYFEHSTNVSHPGGADKYPLWGREHLERVFWKMLIVKYEHSPYWARRFDWFLRRIFGGTWKAGNLPTQLWEGGE